MQKVNEFLTDNRTVFLASLDGDQPRVRPFGFLFSQAEKLYFCTAEHKEVCKQLEKNSKVELSCLDQSMNSLRVSGKVVFCDEPEIKQRIFDISPLIKKIYKSIDNPAFKPFYIRMEKAKFFNLIGQVTEDFEF